MSRASDASLPPGAYGVTARAHEGQPLGSGDVYLTDANGRRIATFFGEPEEKIALAHLVVDASTLREAILVEALIDITAGGTKEPATRAQNALRRWEEKGK